MGFLDYIQPVSAVLVRQRITITSEQGLRNLLNEKANRNRDFIGKIKERGMGRIVTFETQPEHYETVDFDLFDKVVLSHMDPRVAEMARSGEVGMLAWHNKGEERVQKKEKSGGDKPNPASKGGEGVTAKQKLDSVKYLGSSSLGKMSLPYSPGNNTRNSNLTPLQRQIARQEADLQMLYKIERERHQEVQKDKHPPSTSRPVAVKESSPGSPPPTPKATSGASTLGKLSK